MTAQRFDRRQSDEVRRALVDIPVLIARLGLQDGSRRSSGGVQVLCPHHGERTPSCSITRGPDGTVRCKCFGCQWTGDVLTLIAEVRGYSLRDGEQFREVLAEGSEIAGLPWLADEIRDGREPDPNRPVPERPPPKPAPEYPPVVEVLDLWETSFRVTEDAAASGYLASRRIDARLVAEQDLFRVIGPDTARPAWAFYKGLPWTHTGHRLVTRAWAPDGAARSVRVWQCDGRNYPKRLPPTGHRAQGLVLANNAGVEMLRGNSRPNRVVIVEGEPDLASLTNETGAVLGVGSGYWTEEHAKKIPNKTPVIIATDPDEAGELYAHEVLKTLNNRVPVWRLSA